MKERLNEHQEAMAHKAIMEQLWTRPLVDRTIAHYPTPEAATVLVAEARCGYIPSRWVEHLEASTRVIALDPSRSMLDQARQRIDDELQRQIFFVPQRVDALSYADGVFKAAVCLNGMSTLDQLRQGLGELSRVVDANGKLVVVVPTAECFPEMYDMFDEALRAHRLDDAAQRLVDLRAAFIHEASLYALARELGLRDLELTRHSWKVAFDSGRDTLMSPMLRETFFASWVGAIRSSEREFVLRYLADAIDTYFHERVFTCTVHAVSLVATR